jgi:hypothetical protein
LAAAVPLWFVPVFHAGIEQTFAQDALSDHPGALEESPSRMTTLSTQLTT